MTKEKHRSSRGSTTNPHNRFFQHEYETLDEYREHCHLEGESSENDKTQFLKVYPKTIMTRNDSPDVPFTWSINPYQGCEHGCVYCYARNSHEYWGYSSGKDFERVIMYKPEAASLLAKKFESRSWDVSMVALSGNTDCYQPAERKFRITRSLLEVFLRYQNPVGIITKNALILRDFDLLKELHERHLLRVTLSITSLDEDLRRAMEPRTSTVKQRLKALETLTNAGIPVSVNMAPIIPALNSHEVFDLIKEVGIRGAYQVNYIMLRLNGQISDIFEDWVSEAFPARAQKVINQIRETHGGKLNDSRFRDRMRGEGRIAEQVKEMVSLARKRFIYAESPPPLDHTRFEIPSDQMRLF